MIRPTATTLKFAPTGEYIAARIVSLTRKMIDEQVMGSWWTHQDLMRKFEVPPIDRHWDWRNVTVEFEGRSLSSRKVAIVAGDGHVEGVMVLATDPISSAIDAGGRALLVEWLVTAPRNRRELRIDGKDFVKGSGFQLLAWAARLSRHNGYSGRLRLEASPRFRWPIH